MLSHWSVWHQYSSFPLSWMETARAGVLLNHAIWTAGNWIVCLSLWFSNFVYYDSLFLCQGTSSDLTRLIDWLLFCSEIQKVSRAAQAFYAENAKDNVPRNRASKSMDMGKLHSLTSSSVRKSLVFVHFLRQKRCTNHIVVPTITNSPESSSNHGLSLETDTRTISAAIARVLSVHFFVVICSPLLLSSA